MIVLLLSLSHSVHAVEIISYEVNTTGDQQAIGRSGGANSVMIAVGQTFPFNGTQGTCVSGINITFPIASAGDVNLSAYVVSANASGIPDSKGTMYAVSTQKINVTGSVPRVLRINMTCLVGLDTNKVIGIVLNATDWTISAPSYSAGAVIYTQFQTGATPPNIPDGQFYQLNQPLVAGGFGNWTAVSSYDMWFKLFTNGIISDTTPPFFNQTPTSISVNKGTPISININASDSTAFDKYLVNDTTNFKINNINGSLTNNTGLNFGVYSLNVSINDTANNGNSTLFTINITRVNSAPNITSLFPINNTILFFNQTGIFHFNWTINDPDTDEMNVTLTFNNSIINTTQKVINGTYYFNLTNITQDIITAARFNLSIIDNNSKTSFFGNYLIQIDVSPYNTSLILTNSTLLDNQTQTIFANLSHSIDGIITRNANCNASINTQSGEFNLTYATNQFQNITRLPYGVHTANVLCYSANLTSIQRNITLTIRDATPPIINISYPGNLTVVRMDNITFQMNGSYDANRSIGAMNVTIYNSTTTNKTNFNINTGNATVSIPRDSIITFNYTANDNESNTNTSETRILINDWTPPVSNSNNVPASGSVSTQLFIYLNVSDNFQQYNSLENQTILFEIREPSANFINYTASPDTTQTGMNYKVLFTPSTTGSSVTGNIYMTDIVGNYGMNSSGGKVIGVASLPAGGNPVVGGGGGGGGGSPLTTTLTDTSLDAFKITPRIIDTYALYTSFAGIDKTWTFKITPNKIIQSCSCTNNFICDPTKQELSAIITQRQPITDIATSECTFTDATGTIVKVPVTLRLINIAGYTPIMFNQKYNLPILFKNDIDGNVSGIRYVAFAIAGLPLMLFLRKKPQR